MLGTSGKKRAPNQRLAVDASFLSVTLDSDQLLCKWRIRDESSFMIQRDFGSALFIRIKDISGDHLFFLKQSKYHSSKPKSTLNYHLGAGKFLLTLAISVASIS